MMLMALLLVTAVFVVISQTQQANAMGPSQWETVRGYIDSYYGGSQSGGGLNGEAGFRMTKADLVSALDSNNDISPKYASLPTSGTVPGPTTVTGVLGEGDDAANRPVLIDNLMARIDVIPGTEFRCNWNVDGSCFANSSISTIRSIVDNHKAAGFSTDIVDYCVSSQAAGPSTNGFGIIAQVPGALSSDTSLIPKVHILDYSRNGWRNFVANTSGANSVVSPESSAGGFTAPGTPPGTVPPTSCDSSATDLALVECQANWAIAANLGNVSNGQMSTDIIGAAGQSVDVRSGTILTMDTATTTNNNLQVPISTLFSTSGLAQLSPTLSTVLVGRTQMGETSAIGLKMLGYNLIAGGSINEGIPRWNGTEGELQAVTGDNLPTQSIAVFTSAGAVDTTGPSVTSVGSSNVTTNSADIDRVAGEPATMKVEYGTTSGVYTDTVNNTVLNANKIVSLSGLNDGTTYYYRATSYDGQANGTVSAEGSFTTVAACTPAKPSLTLSKTSTYWVDYAAYTARQLSVNWTISNTGTNGATNVAITGSTNTNGVTISTLLPASVGSIGAGSSAMKTLVYNVPLTTGGWWTSSTASAGDDCGGTGYTYPSPNQI